MEIEITVPLATNLRAYDKGEKTFWEDKADAQRLIKAGYAKPVAGKAPERA